MAGKRYRERWSWRKSERESFGACREIVESFQASTGWKKSERARSTGPLLRVSWEQIACVVVVIINIPMS